MTLGPLGLTPSCRSSRGSSFAMSQRDVNASKDSISRKDNSHPLATSRVRYRLKGFVGLWSKWKQRRNDVDTSFTSSSILLFCLLCSFALLRLPPSPSLSSPLRPIFSCLSLFPRSPLYPFFDQQTFYGLYKDSVCCRKLAHPTMPLPAWRGGLFCVRLILPAVAHTMTASI